MKLIAAAAALTLAAGSAFAASPTYNSGAQPAPAQQAMTSDQTGAGQGYQPSVAANPGETAHVIGGQTFYYSSGAGDSASGDGSAD
jgi:hypothetical protein